MLEKAVSVDYFKLDKYAQLSQGTTWVDGVIDGKFNYRGYVPTKPWRTASSSDLEKILLNRSISNCYSNCVGVYRLPEKLFSQSDFLRSYTDSSNFFNTINEHMQSRKYHDWLSAIQTFFKNFLCSSDSMVINGLRCVENNPNLLTSTFDCVQSRYIGLHLDNWDKLPVDQRKKARNRICINIGKGPRYFLFINLSVARIIEKLQVILGYNAKIHHGNLSHQFFKFYPNYPVIKIKILPGEYYVAPTENILHDAYMEGTKEMDIALNLLGFFRVVDPTNVYQGI